MGLSIRIPIDLVKEFLKRISGIRWYLTYSIDENKITIKSPVVSEEKISDLIEISKASRVLFEKTSKVALVSSSREPLVNTIYIKLNGEGLEIECLEKNIFIMSIDDKLLNTLSEVFSLARKSEVVKCSVCGRELLFETYTCPRCGRVVPFIARTCPFCEYDLRYKKCPGHRDVVNYRGSVVKRDYRVFIPISIISLVVILFSIYISTIYPEYSIVFYALGGLVTALLIAIGLVTSKPRA